MSDTKTSKKTRKSEKNATNKSTTEDRAAPKAKQLRTDAVRSPKDPLSAAAAINAGSPMPGSDLFRRFTRKPSAEHEPSRAYDNVEGSRSNTTEDTPSLTRAGAGVQKQVFSPAADNHKAVEPGTKQAKSLVAIPRAAVESIVEASRPDSAGKLPKNVVEHLYQLDIHRVLSVPEFRQYTGTGTAASILLLGYEALGWVTRSWERSKTMFALTDVGKELLDRNSE